MHRRTALKLAASAILAGALCTGAASAEDVIKIGASAAKTGPLAGGSTVSHWPNIQLWVHNVNEKGGIQVGDKKMKVELVEYDDQTSGATAVKNIQRLATVDKVDFIIPPYGTGLVIATAPIFAKYGYPMVAVTAISDKVDELAAKWPNSFWTLGTSTAFAEAVAETLTKLRDKGDIGNKVAVVNVADAFGIELANAGKPALEKAGFEIVYDTSYPLGTQDLAPVINGAKAANPDAFVAFSYPPDTFALTGQAQISDLDVKAFYVGVATSFPAYAGKFGKAAEGVLGAGGVNPDTPEMQAYIAKHTEVTGQAPDYWASAVMYSSLQVLEQAIEAAGSLDKAEVIKAMTDGSFDTVMGTMTFDKNVNRKFWTIGQWQDGVYYGVGSTGLEGAKEPVIKTGWN
ncbi:amino acid ABC transporter substrate-binding protein [Breoghania sp. L-A4]|uniref:amino acid ABC transporter substrate-binding protein n=1 Tax=Breoghania sp. L-A4 TaxID=2304600 RepID=UPI000E35AC78|nr:amino acid ABC transporter substrate-binding protein [Breoghania sp. L-A4]AXS41265.1 branched-chain amino acid ABC transporter substrate-binding protein [Breoghania sp. L-A4]